jgi:pumilio RNA-binding family
VLLAAAVIDPMVTEMATRGGGEGVCGVGGGGEEGAERGDFELFRSGSAPPTVEGAMAMAAGGGGEVLLDDELRADPAYQSYYYSNAHLNPRLPPPLLSKEDWRSSQHRLRSSASGLGGIGDGRRGAAAGAGDGLVGLPGIDHPRQRSFSSIFQVVALAKDLVFFSLSFSVYY